MSIKKINEMLNTIFFPQLEKQRYSKKKSLSILLIAVLPKKVNPYKDIIYIKRRILNITFREERNKLFKRAASLLGFKVLDLKKVGFGKNCFQILNKVIRNYLRNMTLRI